jgi:hypothetical protein
MKETRKEAKFIMKEIAKKAVDYGKYNILKIRMIPGITNMVIIYWNLETFVDATDQKNIMVIHSITQRYLNDF